MLLSFSVTNFRSFRAEQTFNLLASKRLGATDESPHCHPVPGTDEHALRVASLYGANGAGKSNLVKAIDLIQRMVMRGTAPGKPITYKPFLLDDQSPTEPTVFELQYVQEGKVFRYGMCFDVDRVHEEWLGVYQGKNERNLFTRTTTDEEKVTVSLGTATKDAGSSSKIKALAEVGARPNQLFLAEVVNLDAPESQGPLFGQAINWFESSLKVIGPDAAFVPLAKTIATDETFAQFAGEFLQEASTGIASVDVETTPLPKSEFEASTLEALDSVFDDPSRTALLRLSGPEGEDVFIGRDTKGPIELTTIVALHNSGKDQPTRFPFKEESDGSRRLLHLLPALYSLAGQGGVFVIDELERSMHPMLARKFVEFFLKATGGAGSQLIFTTHESTLLDLDLVRRDGIWFTEKDQEGATHLYSLADFKVRKDLRIEKGYLEGRFGAIPFLGGIDHLIEEQTATEANA